MQTFISAGLKAERTFKVLIWGSYPKHNYLRLSVFQIHSSCCWVGIFANERKFIVQMIHYKFIGWFSRLSGTGRALLCSTVFLNAFMNNSKRKYYSLAKGHQPVWYCAAKHAEPNEAKANIALVLQVFLSVFQINSCVSPETQIVY